MLIEYTSKDRHPDFDQLSFVVRCMNLRSENRPHLTHLLIENETVTGTDGSRIHRGTLEGDYTPGLYRIIKATKAHLLLLLNEEIPRETYPDIMFVFNKLTLDNVETICTKFISDGTFIHAFAAIIRALPERFALNPFFVKDLNGEFDIQMHREEGIVLFTGPKKIQQAIVMAMRNG